jgi:hypothetical protein
VDAHGELPKPSSWSSRPRAVELPHAHFEPRDPHTLPKIPPPVGPVAQEPAARGDGAPARTPVGEASPSVHQCRLRVLTPGEVEPERHAAVAEAETIAWTLTPESMGTPPELRVMGNESSVRL